MLVRNKIESLVRRCSALEQEATQIARYVENRYRIALKCRKEGPFICRVERDRLPYYLPPP